MPRAWTTTAHSFRASVLTACIPISSQKCKVQRDKCKEYFLRLFALSPFRLRHSSDWWTQQHTHSNIAEQQEETGRNQVIVQRMDERLVALALLGHQLVWVRVDTPARALCQVAQQVAIGVLLPVLVQRLARRL